MSRTLLQFSSFNPFYFTCVYLTKSTRYGVSYLVTFSSFPLFPVQIFNCSIVTLICSQTCKVCKSVHHRTVQINHQPDATIFQFIILTFIYSSTCFGRFPTHHQELNDCSGSVRFYLPIIVKNVRGRAGRPAGPTTNTARLSRR